MYTHLESPHHQPIIGFSQDEQGHWVALLACGHQQHVRHNPPLVERPWVLTPAGRQSRLGTILTCKRCESDLTSPQPGHSS